MSRVFYATVYRDIAIEVEYTISPGFAGNRIDPPCDPEIEIRDAKWGSIGVDLTEHETARILEDHEDEGPDPDDMRDRMIDDRLAAQVVA